MKNPFEYDAAPNLEPKLLVDWFIEEHNHSRFLQSTRNVIVNGQRGSGKSMALIYNSIPYQKLRSEIKAEPFPSTHAGIYIPCNTALTHKEEYRLLPEIEQAILSEHFFAYGIAASIAKDFQKIEENFTAKDRDFLFGEFAYLTGYENTNQVSSPFVFLQRAVRDRLKKDQEAIATGVEIKFEFETGTFYTLILPVLNALKETELLRGVHLSLLVDDAHDLNLHQKRILNSWLGYRDHSTFSFKVAIAGVRNYDFRTSSEGTILEGHDYITIDFDQPFQNEESNFGKFARDVVEKRLKNLGIDSTADDFFPVNPNFIRDMEECELQAEKECISKGVDPTDTKAIGDYRYKYARVRYFRNRSSKANRPPYSGFGTIAHVSTGVIRNLLEPCYWMYEDALSNSLGKLPTSISPDVQSRVILARSDNMWTFIRNSLDKQLPGCGRVEAEKLNNLFTQLAEYFRERLLKHKSEPRVITFTISGYEQKLRDELEPLLLLAQKAQLIYVRSGPKKKGGGREDYFVPNRMLWPAYALDVDGQHGRASLKAVDLVSATHGEPIPVNFDGTEDLEIQGDLF